MQGRMDDYDLVISTCWPTWSDRKACTKKELESFIGHLCHAATVEHPGRTFLRALFQLLHYAKKHHHFVRLTTVAWADIMWWKCLLGCWSRCSFFISQPFLQQVFTDALNSYQNRIRCGAKSNKM